MRKIVFYAPFGNGIPDAAVGGGEMGCRRTKKIYEKGGLKVIPIDKPAISGGKFKFCVELLLTPFKIYWALLINSNSLLHIAGFYSKNVYCEYFLMRIGKLMKHKVIYEIRNGSMISTYLNGTYLYRKVLKSLIINSDIVLCQGKEYVDFIKKQWDIDCYYYPNYIMDNFIQENNLNRPYPLRLIYFGRVTESKNIDVIIKTLSIIRSYGIDAVLNIVGGYNNQYKAYLDDVIIQEKVLKYVSFYGRKPLEFIVRILRESHYFIFPSQERQEGHSNSLTEAMGCGVVPIVSSAGFNLSICGIPDLVVNIDAVEIANKIVYIENHKKWQNYSKAVYKRVQCNYTQSIVEKTLLNCIDQLFVHSLNEKYN